MENPVLPSSCVTPAGTSIEVQNEWEENTHNTHTHTTIGAWINSNMSGRNPLLYCTITLINRHAGTPNQTCSGVHLFILDRHTPSGQSQVYRVTQTTAYQWRSLNVMTIYCRESAGTTRPVNLKVVPNECCLSRSPRTN